MKVTAKWEYYAGSGMFRTHGQKFELKLVETQYCCDALKQSESVRFGEGWDSMLNINQNVNISNCQPYPEGACWDLEAISFCPFCGTEIEIEIQE